MDRLTALTSSLTPKVLPCLASGAAAAGASAPASAGPPDSYAPGSSSPPPATPLDQATINRLILGKGPATSLDQFFNADRIQGFERVSADRKAGCGGWKITSSYPPHSQYTRREYTLDDNVPAGWTSAWGGPYHANALGAWTRREDGWESSRMVSFPDPKSEIESAMLTMRLDDDGKSQMVLWERLRGGGAIFTRLDSAKWMKHPDAKPDVVEVKIVNPGDPEMAGFFMPPTPPAGPPMFGQFFGPHNQATTFEAFTPTEHSKRSGASVDVQYDWGWMRQVHLFLPKDEKPGSIETSHGMEDQLFLHWERTATGWLGETHARITPDQFSTWKDVKLCTELNEDGAVTGMKIRAEGWRGETEETVLDPADWLAGKSKAPSIGTVRRTEATMPPPRPSSTPEPAQAPGPHRPTGVQDDGGFIIVDGVRIPKRKS